jgi:hypothetical protein
MEIRDYSKDKKYFTIIPNYIANHSAANDQALYFQMKRLVGEEEGICFASEKYFKDKLGIGSKALKKSIQYLIDHKWIEEEGYREIITEGGPQRIKTYLVKDIWKINMEYYNKGVSEREPLSKSKGVSERKQRGVQKEAKGVAFKQQRRTIKNNIEEEREPTPAEESRLFFISKENQEKIIQYLTSKSFPEDTTRAEIKNFISYWTERNKSGKSQRWELEKTFELKRRLSTWFSNAQKFNKTKTISSL